MSLPEVNLYPDFNTLRLSHLTLNVKDIKKSKDFYTHILGLQVTDESRKMFILDVWRKGGIIH